MQLDQLKDFITQKLLDKNGNPSRNKKVSFLTDDLRDEILSLALVTDLNEAMYRILTGIRETPLCRLPGCDMTVKFANFKKGYAEYCSVNCTSKLGVAACRDKVAHLGVSHHTQLPSVQQKRKETNLARYGVEHPLQNKSINEKANEKKEQTNLDRYGVRHTRSLDWVNAKGRKTLYERYGVTNAGYLNKNTSLTELALFYRISAHFPDTISGHRIEYQHRIIVENRYEFETAQCELDIFVPSKNFAIEYNGDRFHTDYNKHRYLHANKYKNCKEKGIRLFQFSDSLYAERKDIIERMIDNFLGVSSSRKIGARQTHVIELEYATASAFLNENHLLGGVASTRYLGLKETSTGELVAVMQFNIPKKNESNTTWELSRYASVGVNGGFGKLLRHFNKTEHGALGVHSILDLRYGCDWDNLYLKNGFTEIRRLAPDFSYYTDGRIVNKRQLRKPELIKMGASGNTETEMAESLALPRIWDAGKVVYELKW